MLRCRSDVHGSGRRAAAWVTVVAVALLCLGARPVLAGDRIEYLGKDLKQQEIQAVTYSGTVIVLAFWATWCGPCREELPWLEALQKAYGRERVTVIALNYDEPLRTVRKVASHETWADMQMVIAYDPRQRVRRSVGKVKAIPHTVVFDRHGDIAYQHTGYNEEAIEALIGQINRLLQTPAPGVS